MTFQVEGELIEDLNGKYLWVTSDGKHVAVENMPDTHLRNCVLFLMDMGYRKCTASAVQRVAWCVVFKKEWARRMQKRAFERDWDDHNKSYDKQKELDDEAPSKQLRDAQKAITSGD